MNKSVSALVTGVTLALISVLAFTFPSQATASTATVHDRAASTTCVSAAAAQGKAANKVKTTKKKVKKARKKFVKAKVAAAKHHTVKAAKKKAKAKKALNKARKKVRKAKLAKKNAKIRSARACAGNTQPPVVAPPVTDEQAAALTAVLKLLLQNLNDDSGSDLLSLNVTQLTELLNTLLPGVSLDSLDLDKLLALLKNGDVSNIGDVITQFQTAFGDLLPLDVLLGLLDPASFAGGLPAVGEILTGLTDALLGGNTSIPGLPNLTDPAAVLGLLAKLQTILDPSAITGLLGTSGLGQLTGVLDKLIGGDALTNGDLSGLVDLVGGFSNTDLADLKNLGVLGQLVAGLVGVDQPGLGDIPGLGPILANVLGGVTVTVCSLPIVGLLLCGL